MRSPKSITLGSICLYNIAMLRVSIAYRSHAPVVRFVREPHEDPSKTYIITQFHAGSDNDNDEPLGSRRMVAFANPQRARSAISDIDNICTKSFELLYEQIFMKK